MAWREAQNPLIGRSRELDRLSGVLESATDGRSGVAVIGGDAGIGKTRLVTEIMAHARARGFAVLVGQCAELGDALPYLPLADALRGASDDPGLAQAIDARPMLRRLVPGGSADPEPEAGSGLAQQQLFGSALAFLSEVSEARPVLFVLEDLHWADRSTRDLLVFLSRMLQRERVCLIGTYRTDDLHRRHPLRPLLAELRRLPSVTALALGPLGDGEMSDHLVALGGADAKVIGDIIDRAEGNPFYAEELLAAEGLPYGLAGLLLARVEKLSDPAQRVLRAAAVAGRRVDHALLLKVSGLDDPGLEEAMREIVSRGVLLPDGDGYAFRHALLQEAVYTDLLPGERTRLHGEFTRLLDGSPAELAYHYLAAHDLPGALAASVEAGRRAESLGAPAEAHRHYDQALALWHRVPDAERVAGISRVRLGLLSAAAAEESGDPHRAVNQMRELLATETPTAELWERLAYYLTDADEPAAAIDAAKSAVTLATSECTPFPIASPTGQETTIGRETTTGRPGAPPDLSSRPAAASPAAASPVGAPETTVGRLRAADSPETPPSSPLATTPAHATMSAVAVAAAPSASAGGDPRVHARALATYARTLLWSTRHDEVEELCGRALRVARAAGVHDAESSALISLATVADIDGDTERAERLLAEASAIRSGDLSIDLRAIFHHARVQYERGSLAAAEVTADRGVRLARETGLSWSVYGTDLSFLRLLIDYTGGDWKQAAAVAAGFAVRVGRLPEARLSGYALFIEVARGDPIVEERLAWLKPFWDDEFVAQIVRALVAEHALWNGDPRAAIDHIRVIIPMLEPFDPALIRICATGLWALADLGESGPEADDLLRRARTATTLGPGSGTRGPIGVEGQAWLARAEAEWRRAQGVADPVLWRVVVEAFDYGAVYELARSRWRLAEALLSTGDRESALTEWRQALTTATALGAAPLTHALTELGRRARFPTPSPPSDDLSVPADGDAPAPPAHSSGPASTLTAREQEVLALVATGLSNREIADRLFIAQKTASVHVSNILAKLGVSSRTQAAAYAHQEGLTT
ncbi:helix-turn-helix transcriptional regulator [Sphaerisporangium siamense]|uniref:DNA-binding CsgD family transcriptional regulator n=1 Tax=Sphaerisporangium siamense TaxID=795645 RepID=A0A7W7GG64_9ACTN|nr:helix-turn-helix transcriptional regulator [Sphaerisporangium siamense]MBB4705761.1 DNA-binding CsgD family transcriptional regulator [Sphaerisporangium siamense]